jgi:hypothetical protein
MSFRRSAIALALLSITSGCDTRKETPSDTTHPATGAAPFEDSLKSGDIAPVEAFLTPLDSSANGRALVELRFNPSPPSNRTITIHPDNENISLRDDGRGGDRQPRDGIFSGIVTLDSRQFADEQKHFSEARLSRVVPTFEGRVKVGRREINKDMLVDFRRPRPYVRRPLGPVAFVDPALKARSLMINGLPVVTDPGRTFDPCTGVGTALGKWTFGHLMTEMANQPVTGVTPADFVEQWLAKWATTQTVNTFPIPARIAIGTQIITPWQTASGGGALDLAKAPFRLLAIVNRVDLRQNIVYGGGSAGEARFVFGAMDQQHGCSPMPFTVIFEYGVKVKSCPALKAWAKRWYDLKGMTPGDPAYLAALEGITDVFSAAGADPSKLPNKSALNQLRTNEIALAPPWELREFRLGMPGGVSGHLSPVTVKQEPDMSFNNSATVAAYVNANAAAIVLDRHTVPETFSGAPFLGSRAPAGLPFPTLLFWGKGADMTTPNSRFHFSLNTCSGCHAGETRTFFTHVNPESGLPAALSLFLTGTPAPGVHDPDPTDADNSDRMFADLDRRALDLDGLVNSPCLKQLGVRPIFRMVH